eukprot:TRINITY_DN75850_c0_g1_i1.p1 TRINITY_DN75850_c0_g1~~TRINITY_DN75850_c0_g1_i1.p1  ORF type:complete len:395 (-),score=79.09 TRINITY_DN75850_c0_g1_i1:251-1387(-)
MEDGFVDISAEKDGSLLKKILVDGAGEETPSVASVATVHYVGTLREDGTMFDSSRDREQAFSFTLGEEDVIHGWEVGVATMRRGEKALLRCAPNYAYGIEGHPPKIPPGATLDFEIELLKWEPKLKEPEEMTVVERSKHVLRCKETGNNAFKREDWSLAIYAYEQGIKYISFAPGKDGIPDKNFDHGGEEQLVEDQTLLVALLTNLAACFLKVGDESQAVDRCTEALNVDPRNVKALFRRSQAHFSCGDWDRVLADVMRMLEIEPQNKAAEQLRRSAEIELKKAEKKSKIMFSKMISDVKSAPSVKTDEIGSEEAGNVIPQARPKADPKTLAGRKILKARRSVVSTSGPSVETTWADAIARVATAPVVDLPVASHDEK